MISLLIQDLAVLICQVLCYQLDFIISCNNMRKTEQLTNKASFRALIDVQNEKLPEKKSRSRSIKDRNTTTNNFSVSRASQIQNKLKNQQNQRARKNTWQNDQKDKNQNHSNKEYSNEKDSNLNVSREQSSIQKIKQHMRKESQQIQQKQRKRSNSRRNRSAKKSENDSRENSFNLFPKAPGHEQPDKTMHNQQQQSNPRTTKDQMNQIIRLKNKLKVIQNNYASIRQKLGQQNSQKYYINNRSIVIQQKQGQLKEKAQDLNNILETFHITFRQNLNKMGRQTTAKMDSYQPQTSSCQPQNNYVQPNQTNTNLGNRDDEVSINTIVKKLETQFCIKLETQLCIGQRNNQNTTSQNTSFFQLIKKDSPTSYSQLQKRLLLAEERLLK